MQIELTRAEYKYIKRRRQNINLIREVLAAILMMCMFLMVIIGCCFDSPNFRLVFTVFLAVAAVAGVAAGGIMILGGEL